MTEKQAQSRQRLLLIANRASGAGDAGLANGIELLRDHDLDIIEHYPNDPDALVGLIHEHRHSVDAVILGGGDGTMNGAAGALFETGLPLGILPMGTANDLARTLAIPADVVGACEIIVSGHSELVDLGRVNDVFFFNAASIGLGADVTRRLSRDVKSRWGVFSYARTVYDAFKACRSFAAEVTCDGHTETLRSIQIMVGNGRFYGGGMTVASDAAIDDQRLDLYSLKPQSFTRLLSLAPVLRAGPQGDNDALDVRHGARIDIRSRKPRSVSTDGEVRTHTPARFQVEAGAVRVFTPAPGSPPAQ